MFRADRSRRGEDPWLVWKVAGFSLGAVLTVLGIILERDILIQVAIGVLVLALMTRLLPGRTEAAADDGPEEARGPGTNWER